MPPSVPPVAASDSSKATDESAEKANTFVAISVSPLFRPARTMTSSAKSRHCAHNWCESWAEPFCFVCTAHGEPIDALRSGRRLNPDGGEDDVHGTLGK